MMNTDLSNPRSVLVAIDPDQPSPGLIALAVRLAQRRRVTIRLVCVVEAMPWYTRLALPSSAESFQSLLRRDREAVLQRLSESLLSQGVEASTEVLHGRIHVELVREVLRGGHSLLLKASQPSSRSLLSSTDMQLLRTCPCPVWLVRPGQGERPFDQIMAAIDPEPAPGESEILDLRAEIDEKDPNLDRCVLDLAHTLAETENATLHVLHAWSAPGEEQIRGKSMLPAEQVDRYITDARLGARRAVEALVGSMPDPTGRRQVHLLKGEPAEVIARFAETHQIQLIVMGTIARTGLGSLLIGNTAESILQRVDCSVLAIKPQGFVSPIKLEA